MLDYIAALQHSRIDPLRMLVDGICQTTRHLELIEWFSSLSQLSADGAIERHF